MPSVYRISLVVMSFADVVRRKQTPIPFLEMRAFLFIARIPNPTEEIAIKRALKRAIEEDLMKNFLAHIFESDKSDQSFSFLSRQTAKEISLKQLTNRFKVEIEGYEVEKIDVDEIITEPIYWSESPIGRTVDHFFFNSERTAAPVLKGMTRLHRKVNTVYHYVAFYDENGDLDGEYDEFQVRQYIQQRVFAMQQRQQLFTKARGLVTDIELKTNKLSGVIDEIDQLNRKWSI